MKKISFKNSKTIKKRIDENCSYFTSDLTSQKKIKNTSNNNKYINTPNYIWFSKKLTINV